MRKEGLLMLESFNEVEPLTLPWPKFFTIPQKRFVKAFVALKKKVDAL